MNFFEKMKSVMAEATDVLSTVAVSESHSDVLEECDKFYRTVKLVPLTSTVGFGYSDEESNPQSIIGIRDLKHLKECVLQKRVYDVLNYKGECIDTVLDSFNDKSYFVK